MEPTTNSTVFKIYEYFNTLSTNYDSVALRKKWDEAIPYPHLAIDNFLPQDVLELIQQEVKELPDSAWTHFDRNGSFMSVCQNFSQSPILQTVFHCLNSGAILKWIESITGNEKMLSDTKLIGSGLTLCRQGDSLGLHVDFNWNEQLQLNRYMNFIIYLGPEWKEEWEGALEFWDNDRTHCVTKIYPVPNRLILWNHDEKNIHGYPRPLQCPEDNPRLNLLTVYYKSNSTPIVPPHRSLYWWDDEKKVAHDKRNET